VLCAGAAELTHLSQAAVEAANISQAAVEAAQAAQAAVEGPYVYIWLYMPTYGHTYTGTT